MFQLVAARRRGGHRTCDAPKRHTRVFEDRAGLMNTAETLQDDAEDASLAVRFRDTVDGAPLTANQNPPRADRIVSSRVRPNRQLQYFGIRTFGTGLAPFRAARRVP